MNERLVDWLWEHPKEAQGINITMSGADVIILFKRALEWCKMEYRNMQQPAMLSTEEVCRAYKVSQKHLYNLARDKDRNGNPKTPSLHPVLVAGKNMYTVSELESVLKNTSPSKGDKLGNLLGNESYNHQDNIQQ